MPRDFKKILRNTVLPLAVGVQLVTFVASHSFAQEAVGLRAWAHSDFGRLVFDWPSDVTLNAQVQNNQLVLSFSKPFNTSLSTVYEQLSAYVGEGQLVNNNTQLVFPLKQPIAVSSFKNGLSVVVDLKPGAQSQTVAASSDTATPTAEQVRVRVGGHSEFTRLVFDWPRNIEYSASMETGRLALSFSARAAFDLNEVSGQLPEGLGQLASEFQGGATSFILQAPASTGLRHFKAGTKIVVDLVKDAVPVQEAESAAANEASEQSVPEVSQTDSAPEVIASPEPEQEVLPQIEAAPTTAVSDADADASVATVTETAPDLTPEEIAAQEIATQEAAAQAAIEAGTLDLKRPDQEELAQALVEKKKREADNKNRPDPVTISFPWPENVGAAVYRRGENIWVVFDRRGSFDLAPIRAAGQPLIEKIEQLPIGGATVFRVKVPAGINPVVSKEGFDWSLTFRQAPISASIPVAINADVNGEIGPHINFPMDNPGAMLNIPDPDVGDSIRVATIEEPGIGVSGQRAYPEFSILASAQGLAIEALSDEVVFDRELDGFRLKSADGLHISAISPEAPLADASQISSKRLFNFETWKRGGEEYYQEDRKELMQAILLAEGGRKNLRRLDLAQFYLAHGLGPEAKGVLQVVRVHDKAIETKPDFRALLGVAHLLNRDYQQALVALNDPRLDGFEEVALWRGAALGEAGQWKEAAEEFKKGEGLLMRYPYPLKAKLGIIRIEAALATRNIRSAETWLNELDKESYELTRSQQAVWRYHFARISYTKNSFDAAAEIWSELANGKDQYAAVRAQYGLVNLDL
ncbi:MAG: hypothetical protein R3261_02870, partial [Alphaproteobacteria bacterium]|nr:hypothetical protein [Alphaproteobacteria bacterium]